jgi:methylase of polypeptide subunit release factors
MTTASNQAKARWNSNHYTQVKVAVDPELASSFKAACMISNVSMASKLSEFMAEYSGIVRQNKNKTSPDYSTRRKRRAAIKHILLELEQIKAEEERFIDNAPANLQSAPAYETADECVSALDEAIEQLGSIYQ